MVKVDSYLTVKMMCIIFAHTHTQLMCLYDLCVGMCVNSVCMCVLCRNQFQLMPAG